MEKRSGIAIRHLCFRQKRRRLISEAVREEPQSQRDLRTRKRKQTTGRASLAVETFTSQSKKTEALARKFCFSPVTFFAQIVLKSCIVPQSSHVARSPGRFSITRYAKIFAGKSCESLLPWDLIRVGTTLAVKAIPIEDLSYHRRLPRPPPFLFLDSHTSAVPLPPLNSGFTLKWQRLFDTFRACWVW